MRAVGMRITAWLAVLASAAVVSSCGSAQDARSTEHNAADVAFARAMIPHHQQGVDMSAMVPSRTANPDVIVIAKHIELDQQAEIEVLEALLAQWGEPAAPEHGGHEGHGGTALDGMVDAATMNLLESLTGPEFDVLWLRSMIRHHQGAIAMAEPEIAAGENPAAVKMANIIVEWQQFEIARMSRLLTVPK